MADDIIEMIAPLLPFDATVEDALARGRAANSFAVVEEREGTFRLHPIEALERTAHHGSGIRLGNLEADDVKLYPAELRQADEASALHRLGADVAIYQTAAMGSSATALIVGFSRADRYLGRMAVSTSWYQCTTSGCTDKKRYRSSGQCAFRHPLAKKP